MLKNNQFLNLFIRKILLICTLLLAIQMFSHGDLSERILLKTIEIIEDQNNNKLYYEIGFLYQQPADYNDALKDYLKSKSLGNTNQNRLAEVHYLTELNRTKESSITLKIASSTINQ